MRVALSFFFFALSAHLLFQGALGCLQSRTLFLACHLWNRSLLGDLLIFRVLPYALTIYDRQILCNGIIFLLLIFMGKVINQRRLMEEGRRTESMELDELHQIQTDLSSGCRQQRISIIALPRHHLS